MIKKVVSLFARNQLVFVRTLIPSRRQLMPIPDYQSVMLPMLQMCADGAIHHTASLAEPISDHFGLSDGERREMIPSGQSTLMRNRVGWARTYLKMARLAFYPKRGYLQITDRGKSILDKPPEKITVEYLKQYPEFVEFWTRKGKPTDELDSAADSDQSPDDAMAGAYLQMRAELESEVLINVKSI